MLLKLLTDQKTFSQDAFGPLPRLSGVHEHLTKELEELIAEPDDLTEWADCLLLAFDGAMRAGATPSELADYMVIEDIEEHRAFYKGRWHELRRDVGHIKTCKHLETWRAWAIIAVKFLVAATRCGFTVNDILQAASNKLEVNKNRTWPDWRTIPSDQAIEHKK